MRSSRFDRASARSSGERGRRGLPGGGRVRRDARSSPSRARCLLDRLDEASLGSDPPGVRRADASRRPTICARPNTSAAMFTWCSSIASAPSAYASSPATCVEAVRSGGAPPGSTAKDRSAARPVSCSVSRARARVPGTLAPRHHPGRRPPVCAILDRIAGRDLRTPKSGQRTPKMVADAEARMLMMARSTMAANLWQDRTCDQARQGAGPCAATAV